MAEEAQVRNSLCQAAQQLWMRGLLVADGGLVSAEVHRRRYLATPAGRRRADLRPDQLITVDLGGVNVQPEPGITEDHWRPHRIAYQIGMYADPAAREGARPIGGTVLANPPAAEAMLALLPESPRLDPVGHPAIPVVSYHDGERGLEEAISGSVVIAIRDVGLFAAHRSLHAAVNAIERAAHALGVTLLTGQRL